MALLPLMDKGVNVKEVSDLRDGSQATPLTRRRLIQGATAAGLAAPLTGLVESSRVSVATWTPGRPHVARLAVTRRGYGLSTEVIHA